MTYRERLEYPKRTYGMSKPVLKNDFVKFTNKTKPNENKFHPTSKSLGLIDKKKPNDSETRTYGISKPVFKPNFLGFTDKTKPSETRTYGISKPEFKPKSLGFTNKTKPNENRFNPSSKPPGFIDKLCIHSLPGHLVDQINDMPIKIPESLDLPEPILACIYHRYLTTIQTLCVEPKLFGYSDSNCGMICVDGDLIKKGQCKAAIFDDVVDEAYRKQLKVQFGCSIHSDKGGNQTDVISTFDKFVSDHRSTQITMIVFNLKPNDHVTKMDKVLSYLSDKKDVRQITIKIYYYPEKSSMKGYVERLSFFRNLYKLGYRIFLFDRSWGCLPRAHTKQQFLTCYSVYLIRPLQTLPQLVTIPPKTELQVLNKTEILRIYDRFLSSFQILCQQNLRFGNIRDGGWNICHDPKYRPKPPCIIYSFGINYDWSFDDTASEVYGCDVFSFDPSMKNPNHKHSEKVWFYNIGIAEKDYVNNWNWTLRTLGSIMKMLNHTNQKIDILKMDVESAEWPFLSQVLETDILKNVGQIYFEFHYANTADRLLLIKKLYDQGFRIFWTHRNPVPQFRTPIDGGITSMGFEVYFINKNFYA